jgi:hypothetical protein
MQLPIDGLENAPQIAIDIAVPKTKSLESLSFEMLVTFAIIQCMIVSVVLSAINLNDEALSKTDKSRM